MINNDNNNDYNRDIIFNTRSLASRLNKLPRQLYITRN